MAVLTQRDLSALVAEIKRFEDVDPETIDMLISRASAWLGVVARRPGVGSLLVRDVTAICAYARMADRETRRLAAGALTLVLDADLSSEAVLIGRHLALSAALHEIRLRRGDSAGHSLTAVSVEDRRAAESFFLNHAETPLYPDEDLVRLASALCDELTPLSGATFVAHLIMGTRLLIEKLGEPDRDGSHTWARAGLSYLLRKDDAVDDRLGLVGLLDDLYIVETALRFIQPGRAPLDAILRELLSVWPFLLNVVLEEGEEANPASEFLLLNLAFASRDLVGDNNLRLAVSAPGTGPIPFLVAFLAGLGEQQRSGGRAEERFLPGQLVLINGGACATFRGRRIDQTGDWLLLEFPSHVKRAGPVTRTFPLWFESFLTLAPPDRRPGGEPPKVGRADARPVSVLQHLFHLNEPLIPKASAKKILVISDRSKARALATDIRLQGRPLVEVLPMGHLNNRGEIVSWSTSTFGAQEPLVVVAPLAERAATFVEERSSEVALVVIDGERLENAAGEIRRVTDSQLPVLAFFRDDTSSREASAVLTESGARTWTWSSDDLNQMQWRSSRGTGALATYEQRLEAASKPDIRTILVESTGVTDLFIALRGLSRSLEGTDDAEFDYRVGQLWSIGLELIRATSRLESSSALSVRERLKSLTSSLEADRFVSSKDRKDIAAAVSALDRLTARLEIENPKANALATLLKDSPDLAVVRDLPKRGMGPPPLKGAVLTHWLGRERMLLVLRPPIASPLHILLYPPERAWYQSYSNAQSSAPASVSAEAERKNVFPKLVSVWSTEQDKERRPAAPTTVPAAPEPDVDDTRRALFRGRARQLLNRADLQAGEAVEARLVVFRERACAFLTDGYDANVVTHLLSSRGDETPEVKVRRPAQLALGDVVIFTEGDRDAIREYADRALSPGTRDRAKLWQRAFRRWRERTGYSIHQIAELLALRGRSRHEVTIRKWLMDDNLIGPRESGDIRALADLIGDEELTSNLDACEQAVRTVRGEHLRAAGQLAVMIADRAAGLIAEAKGEPLKLDDVFIVTVEHLSEKLDQVPRGAANKLIFDPQSPSSTEST